MKKVYRLSVKLLSDMHINGGVSTDSVRLIVKQDNKPYIPASLVKGVVRNNFEKLLNTFGQDTDRISELFFGGEGFSRSHSIFDNLTSEQETVIGMRTNISINRYSRKADDGALVNSETVSCYTKNGEHIIFHGDVTVYYFEEMLRYEKCFLEAFRLITSFGSGKSRGLGFAEVDINETAC